MSHSKENQELNSGCLVAESTLLILNDALLLVREVNNSGLIQYLQGFKFGNVLMSLQQSFPHSFNKHLLCTKQSNRVPPDL